MVVLLPEEIIHALSPVRGLLNDIFAVQDEIA